MSAGDAGYLVSRGRARFAFTLLFLLYMFDYRIVHGSIEGTNLTVTGVTARWKVSFADQLGRIEKEIAGTIEKEGAP